MTLTVSISEFRNNISDYLDRVTSGTRVLIRDDRKDKTIAQITSSMSFDHQAYEQAMRKAAGVFTAKNHPEWRTKRDVVNWLRKSRMSDDRKF